MLLSSKSQRVDLRVSPAVKQMIQAAVKAQHKTVSEFLLDSGLASAVKTLADRRLFIFTMPDGPSFRLRWTCRPVLDLALLDRALHD